MTAADDLRVKATLTIPELCDAVAHIRPDEPTLHPAVQVGANAARDKALAAFAEAVEPLVEWVEKVTLSYKSGNLAAVNYIGDMDMVNLEAALANHRALELRQDCPQEPYCGQQKHNHDGKPAFQPTNPANEVVEHLVAY